MCVELKTTQSPTDRPPAMDLRPKSTNNLEFWISKGWYVSSTSQTLPHNKLYWFWMCKFLPGMFKICHTCHLYLQKLEVMLETDELDARDENSICFGSKFISPPSQDRIFFSEAPCSLTRCLKHCTLECNLLLYWTTDRNYCSQSFTSLSGQHNIILFILYCPLDLSLPQGAK